MRIRLLRVALKKSFLLKTIFLKVINLKWSTGWQFPKEGNSNLIIIKGKARMRIGDKYFTIKAGETIMVAPKEVHSMKNIGSRDVEYYVIGLSADLGGKTITLE